MKQLMKTDTGAILKAIELGQDVAKMLKGINDRGLEILDTWARAAATSGVRVTHFGRISPDAGVELQNAITAEQNRRFMF